jgi:DNA-binding CsgD family transcriptional regulator
MENKERLITISIFIMVILLLIGDLVEDFHQGSSFEHILQESVVMILGLVGILTLTFRYFVTRSRYKRSESDLKKVREDLTNFKNETKGLTQGMSQKIDEQLEMWKLTKAEKDISLLILKGLSNKEVANIRSTSEKTVRQQATSIYQKSGLGGRSELSAFFLEDILFPPEFLA